MSKKSPEVPAAAWYQDPRDAAQLRWWDGSQWSENTTLRPSEGTPPPPAASPAALPSVTPVAPAAAGKKIPIFGARKAAEGLQAELDAANTSLAALGGMEHAEVQKAIQAQQAILEDLQNQCLTTMATLADLQSQIVATQEEQILQEVGIYEYRHPLTDAANYQDQLKALQAQIKEMAKSDGGAVTGAATWTVNDSAAQGRKMVRENCKLMLRAYNAEADNLVRGLKPYKLDSASARLSKVADIISKLGKTMSVSVTPAYQDLRLRELSLTADFLAKKEEEKEQERADKERLREEAKAQKEIAQEKERLAKEQAHYLNALEKLQAKGDDEAVARMKEQIAEIKKAIEDVDYRAANIRAGYIYVISNVGAFGDEVVKVGLTRRLDPMDRVRELGDASVPFRYDVHAIIFTDDAVGIEHELHQRLADKRLNRVNLRREFFRATPEEIKAHLKDLNVELLEFTVQPEALEYRQSLTMAEATAEAATAPTPGSPSAGKVGATS